MQKVLAQQKALQEAQEAYDENSLIVQKYTQDLNKAKAELNTLSRELERNEKALYSNEAGVADLSEEMDGGMDKADAFAAVLSGNLASKGLERIADAAIDATKAIAEFAAEADRALAMTQARLGATAGEAEVYQRVLTGIYADGFAENMEEAADALSKIEQQMKGLSVADLQEVSNQAIILDKVFGIDVQEGLRGADALMKQFGLDAQTAFDLMAAGAQQGLNQNGDLADQIAEYAVHYADAGYSANQMFAIMQSGVENGAYQIDYLNDAVKGFGIRAKDNSDSVAEAFAGLGLNAQQMFSMFAAGGEQAQEAAKMVNAALFAMEDRLKQNEIGVALYDTKWEDLGMDAVRAMAEAQVGLEDFSGAALAAGEAMHQNFADQMRILKQEIAAAVYEVTHDIITPEIFAEKMTDIMTRISDTISQNAPMILDKGFDLVEGFGEALADAAPEMVPDIIQMIVQIAQTLIEHIPDIAAVAPQIVGGLAIGLINAIPELLLAVPKLLLALAESFADYDIELIEIGVNIVKGIIKGIQNAWSELKKGFISMIKSLPDAAAKELDIHSPSRVFRDEIGKQIVAGIAEGIEKNKDKALEAAEELSQELLKAAEDYVEEKKFYNDLTLQEEMAFWEEMKTMSEFRADELGKIDRKIYTTKQSILEEEQKLMEEYEKSVRDRTNSLADFAGLFDAIESEEVSGEDLIANLEGQVQAFREWQENMEALQQKGVAGELLTELRELGPGSADEVAALNRLTEAELERYIALFQEKGRLAKEQAQNEIGPMLIAQAAQNAVEELQDDLQSDAAGMGKAVAGAVASAVAGAKEETAAETMTQVLSGMQAQYPLLEEYIEATKEEIIALIEGYWRDFRSVGEDMMRGVAQGIRDGRSGVVNAVAAVIAAAVERAKDDLDIHSPSKVFAEIGGFMAQGLAEGWRERMRLASDTISRSLNSLSLPYMQPQAAVSGGNQTYSYGDINVYVDKLNNANGRDTQTLAAELEFYRRQTAAGRGGI